MRAFEFYGQAFAPDAVRRSRAGVGSLSVAVSCEKRPGRRATDAPPLLAIQDGLLDPFHPGETSAAAGRRTSASILASALNGVDAALFVDAHHLA